MNECDLVYDTPTQDAKRAAVLGLLARMKAARAPVDALGVEACQAVDPFSAAKLRRFRSWRLHPMKIGGRGARAT